MKSLQSCPCINNTRVAQCSELKPNIMVSIKLLCCSVSTASHQANQKKLNKTRPEPKYKVKLGKTSQIKCKKWAKIGKI